MHVQHLALEFRSFFNRIMLPTTHLQLKTTDRRRLLRRQNGQRSLGDEEVSEIGFNFPIGFLSEDLCQTINYDCEEGNGSITLDGYSTVSGMQNSCSLPQMPLLRTKLNPLSPSSVSGGEVFFDEGSESISVDMPSLASLSCSSDHKSKASLSNIHSLHSLSTSSSSSSDENFFFLDDENDSICEDSTCTASISSDSAIRQPKRSLSQVTSCSDSPSCANPYNMATKNGHSPSMSSGSLYVPPSMLSGRQSATPGHYGRYMKPMGSQPRYDSSTTTSTSSFSCHPRQRQISTSSGYYHSRVRKPQSRLSLSTSSSATSSSSDHLHGLSFIKSGSYSKRSGSLRFSSHSASSSTSSRSSGSRSSCSSSSTFHWNVRSSGTLFTIDELEDLLTHSSRVDDSFEESDDNERPEVSESCQNLSSVPSNEQVELSVWNDPGEGPSVTIDRVSGSSDAFNIEYTVCRAKMEGENFNLEITVIYDEETGQIREGISQTHCPFTTNSIFRPGNYKKRVPTLKSPCKGNLLPLTPCSSNTTSPKKLPQTERATQKTYECPSTPIGKKVPLSQDIELNLSPSSTGTTCTATTVTTSTTSAASMMAGRISCFFSFFLFGRMYMCIRTIQGFYKKNPPLFFLF